MISFIENSLFFGAAVSLVGYEIGLLLKKKFKMALFNPLLIAILCVMGVLQLMQVDYKTYNAGGQYISYLLTPATVCLAVPLYRQLTLLRKNLKAVIIGIVSGVLASMVSVLVFAKLFGLSHSQYVTLLPKSITTAIGMGVSEELGGLVTITVALSEVWAKGGEGGKKLAEEVIRLVEEPNDFTYSYELEGSIEDKLNNIVQKIYGGKRVVLTANAQKQAKQLEALGFGNCPICVAKTQYSLTDDQTKLGAPTDFEVTVRNLKISAGAGFIVALTGEIMTMPGLPKVPAAEKIDVDETGKITGLF